MFTKIETIISSKKHVIFLLNLLPISIKESYKMIDILTKKLNLKPQFIIDCKTKNTNKKILYYNNFFNKKKNSKIKINLL